MEAQITAGMKTPVLSSRPGPEGFAGDKGRKRESEALSRTHSTERDEQVSKMPLQGPGFCEQSSHTLCCHFCVLSPLCKSNLSDFVTLYIMSLFSHKGTLHTTFCRRYLGPST